MARTQVDLVFKEHLPGTAGVDYLENIKFKVREFDTANDQAFTEGRKTVGRYEDVVKDAVNGMRRYIMRTKEAAKATVGFGNTGAKSVDKVDKELQQLNKNTKNTTGAMRGFLSVAQRALAGIAVGAAIKGIADLGIEAEQTQVSFETFLGSAEKAREVIGDLNQFSTVTPFRPEQVINAGKALLAFGIESEKLIPTLKNIGDVSAATGKDFNELALIYGKARTAGTLYAEDINQLTEAGIPIIEELSKVLGVNESQIKKLASEGRIGFEELEIAFQNLTGEGGRFFNLMEKQSQTVGGRISTLQGNFQALARSLGEAANPALGELVEITNGFVQSINPDDIIAFFSPIGDLLLPALEGLYDAFSELVSIIFGFNQEGEDSITMGQLLAGAFELVVKALTGVINVISFVVNGFNELYKSSSLVRGVVDGLRSAVGFLADKLEDLFDWVIDLAGGNKEMSDELNKSNGFMMEQQKTLAAMTEEIMKTTGETKKLGDETRKTGGKTKELGKSAAETEKEIKALRKEYEKLTSDLEKRVNVATLDELDRIDTTGIARIGAERDLALRELEKFRKELEENAKKLGIKADFSDDFKALADQINEEAKQAIQAALDASRNINNALERGISGAIEGDLTINLAALENAFEDDADKTFERIVKQRIATQVEEGATDFNEDTITDKFERLKDKIIDAIGIDDQTAQAIFSGLNMAFDSFLSGRQQLVEAELEANQAVIDQLDGRVEQAEEALDRELQLKLEGFANNYDAEKESLDTLQAEREAAQKKQIQLQKDAEKQQRSIDTAQQVSSLITATANIFKGFSSIPIVGQILAAAAVASMFALFAKSKVDARKAAKLRTGKKFDKVKGRTHEQGGEVLVHRSKQGKVRNIYEAEDGERLIGTKPSREHDKFLDKLNRGEYAGKDLERIVERSKDNAYKVTHDGKYEIRADHYTSDSESRYDSKTESRIERLKHITPIIKLPAAQQMNDFTLPRIVNPLPAMLKEVRTSEERVLESTKEREQRILEMNFRRAIEQQTEVLKNELRTKESYLIDKDGNILTVSPSAFKFKPAVSKVG